MICRLGHGDRLIQTHSVMERWWCRARGAGGIYDGVDDWLVLFSCFVSPAHILCSHKEPVNKRN